MLNIYFVKSLAIINNTKLSLLLSNIIFNNDCGILANFYGEFRKKLSTSVKVFENNDIFFIKQNNYLWLKVSKTSIPTLNQLTKSFDQLCKKSKIPKSLRLEIHSSRKNNENKNILNIAEKILPEDVINICRGYFGKNITIQNHHIYRNFSPKNHSYHDESMYGSTDKWHIDRSPTNTLKVFILLHNVTSKHGPMEFKITNLNNNKSKRLNIIGKKGDILIINTNILEHRATYPEKNITRDLLCYNIQTT